MADIESEDLYGLLGVPKTATKAEIQSAYKQKARKLHPDVNKSPDAEDRFKQVAAAYAILKDPEQRKRYDTYGLNRRPSPGPTPGAQSTRRRSTAGRNSGFRPADFGFGDVRFEDINLDPEDMKNPFDFFLRREQRRRKPPKREREVRLKIKLEDAYAGRTLDMVLDLPDDLGRTETKRIRIKIPKGAKQGDKLKLKDPECTVILEFEENERWIVDGRNLSTSLDLTPWEAVLGGKVTLETPGGPVTLKVPAGSSSGQKLRLRGKGLPQKPNREGEPGDLYATLRVVTPKTVSDEERALWEKLADLSDFDPRR